MDMWTSEKLNRIEEKLDTLIKLATAKSVYTCYGCSKEPYCKYAFNPANTNGICIISGTIPVENSNV